MNSVIKIIVLFLALGIGNLIYKINLPETVVIPSEEWSWAEKNAPAKVDSSIVPFKIDINQKILDDLKHRLKTARDFTPPLDGIQQQYGINTNLLKKIVNYWINDYDWRSREKFLNQFPQFKTNIQGLNIHFIHVKPKSVPADVKVIPLMLLHGWPGSVREFYEMIPLLTTVQKDKKFVFEVVVPSLPGYGFSDAAKKPGLGTSQAAVLFKTLMKRLGFDRYYVQGGDWGSAVATEMAIFYPEFVKGIHLNMCMTNGPMSRIKTLVGALWPRLVVDEEHEHKMYPLSSMIANVLEEFGYMHLQATKPDTVGVSLNDSPVGLAAYIIEKFTTWTNSTWKNRLDGGLTEKFTYEKLLDNVMIYWVTNSITTSMRFYAESINRANNAFEKNAQVPVPTACAIFKNEIFYQPNSFLKEKYPNVIQTNEYDGGHFAAFEVPASLAKDVWLAVQTMETKGTKSSTKS